MYLYVMKDAATRFLMPVAQESDQVAIRSFVNALRSPEMMWNKKDFDLYCIGEYDPDTGMVTPSTPRCVCFGSSYIFDGGEKNG